MFWSNETGHFIVIAQTLKQMKEEFFVTKLIQRNVKIKKD